jgi:hypothetical protein
MRIVAAAVPQPLPDHRRRITFGCRWAAALLVTGALLAACSSGDRRVSAEPTVRDSAGITIVEHPETLAAGAEWTLSLESAVRAGGEFARVRHGVRFGDGRFVVADGDSRSLRFHGADGA